MVNVPLFFTFAYQAAERVVAEQARQRAAGCFERLGG